MHINNILANVTVYVLMIVFIFFFLKIRAPPDISPLSLHDALPIYLLAIATPPSIQRPPRTSSRGGATRPTPRRHQDRKSTRLNSSHMSISYAVFCLKKKKNIRPHEHMKFQFAERNVYNRPPHDNSA